MTKLDIDEVSVDDFNVISRLHIFLHSQWIEEWRKGQIFEIRKDGENWSGCFYYAFITLSTSVERSKFRHSVFILSLDSASDFNFKSRPPREEFCNDFFLFLSLQSYFDIRLGERIKCRESFLRNAIWVSFFIIALAVSIKRKKIIFAF